ncbi:MAG: hypothetical protein QNJ88_11665 [Acidimicrobiia bacterium]|nr:hypothetical protein [Acidimicrobiia bacterium]
MRRSRAFVVVLMVTALVAAACGSGPSQEALDRNRKIATTTTTEPPPEGTTVIKIVNGAFQPAIVEIDLDVTPIIEWRHEDTSIEGATYVISTTTRVDGELPFQSDELALGDTFTVDFGQLPPDIYRYFALIGFNRLPGTIDTRPKQ